MPKLKEYDPEVVRRIQERFGLKKTIPRLKKIILRKEKRKHLRDKVRFMAKEGHSRKAIALILKIYPTTVYKYLKGTSGELKTLPKPPSKDESKLKPSPIKQPGKDKQKDKQMERGGRYSYYCNRCEENFQSKLPRKETICIKCGSTKVVLI